jgi:hypothetical protein
MAVARCITATGFLAGLALGLAAPAGAWGPPGPAPFPADFQTDGHYIGTQIDPKTGQPLTIEGHPVTNNWYFTPCGDGCALLAAAPGGQPLWQARLVNNQWTMDGVGNVVCADGVKVPHARTAHFTWDPSTLAGTVVGTYLVQACSHPVGGTETNSIQLRQAP